MSIKPRILIIDDEPQIRKILKIALEAESFLCFTADTGAEGIIAAASQKPQLIILDLGLPDKDGISVLSEIRSWDAVPVIILSVRNSTEDIITALDKGADDYLTKPFIASELIARIRACLRRSSVKDSVPIFINGHLKIDYTSRVVLVNNKEIKLTATEYSLLVLFAQNTGKVLTHSFILKEIWGSPYLSQNQYPRVFVGQLRKKIEQDPSNPELIVTESGIGYRMMMIAK